MPLTIVTYHFVRDLQNSRYPAIKGRTLDEFGRQLEYFGRRYVVVTTSDVVAACKGEEALPDNAIWLTFDDGYLDHYTNVFPKLYERKMHGAFFPAVNAAIHGKLLEVNQAHFIRAAEPDPAVIIKEIHAFIDGHEGHDEVRPFEDYWREYAKPVRFDSAEIWFIKSILQHALPASVRTVLVDKLFAKFVSMDQRAFAAELYASVDQLRLMQDCGMYIGGHGAKHLRLNQLSDEDKRAEITESVDFLRQLGAPTSDWVMCYPYGESDETLRHAAKEAGCAVGLTIRKGLVEVGEDDPLQLPRIDTIELPIA